MGVRTYDNKAEPWRGLPGPGLAEAVVVALLATALLLANGRPLGEPQLSKRNLRDSLGGSRSTLAGPSRLISDILAMADGSLAEN